VTETIKLTNKNSLTIKWTLKNTMWIYEAKERKIEERKQVPVINQISFAMLTDVFYLHWQKVLFAIGF
jgi:hypothetical protein